DVWSSAFRRLVSMIPVNRLKAELQTSYEEARAFHIANFRLSDVWSSAFRRSVSMIPVNRLKAELQTSYEEAKMRFTTMVTITVVMFIAAGAAFVFKGWDLVTAYGGPEVPIRDGFRVAWMLRATSFAYLYGTALLGGGLVIWAVRNTRDITTQTNVSL